MISLDGPPDRVSMAHGWRTDSASPMRFSADRNATPCVARPCNLCPPDLIRDHALLRSGRPDSERDSVPGRRASSVSLARARRDDHRARGVADERTRHAPQLSVKAH